MPLLASGFITGFQKPIQPNTLFIISALFFSWLGDVFLQAEGMFLPGLASFLLAHVSYIFYFIKTGLPRKGMIQQHPLYALPVLIYIFSFLYFLFPYLGALSIPVVIYSMTIGLMLICAMNSRIKVPAAASGLFIAGAILFMISDSVLAVDLFAIKNPFFGLVVMISYTLAQLLIVKGALAELKTDEAV
jgi:uncharacterized membrane protein YhhN